jgi:hypothetical protein
MPGAAGRIEDAAAIGFIRGLRKPMILDLICVNGFRLSNANL